MYPQLQKCPYLVNAAAFGHLPNFSHSLMVPAFKKSGLKMFGSGFLFKILNDFNSMALYKAVSQTFSPVFVVNIDHKSSL